MPDERRGERNQFEPMSDYETLLRLMRERRSVRKFSNRAVGREQIEQLMEAARWAPSNHNRQPWRISWVH
jgi:coenzyme F420-0:L-glutamate ligase / coenzyme F420-1:gamma-L-glutamate ligase